MIHLTSKGMFHKWRQSLWCWKTKKEEFKCDSLHQKLIEKEVCVGGWRLKLIEVIYETSFGMKRNFWWSQMQQNEENESEKFDGRMKWNEKKNFKCNHLKLKKLHHQWRQQDMKQIASRWWKCFETSFSSTKREKKNEKH